MILKGSSPLRNWATQSKVRFLFPLLSLNHTRALATHLARSHASLLEQREVLNSHRIGFVSQRVRRFIVLERHYHGWHDDMRWWRLKSSFVFIFNNPNSHFTVWLSYCCQWWKWQYDVRKRILDSFIPLGADIQTYYSGWTSISSHLSTKAFFCYQRRPQTFTVILTSLQRPLLHNGNDHQIVSQMPKKPLDNGILINEWRVGSTKRHVFFVEGHENCSSLCWFLFYCFIFCRNSLALIR